MPMIGVFAPRSLSFLPGVIGLIGFAAHWIIHKKRPELCKTTTIIVSSVLLLTGASCLWSVNFELSSERVLKLLPVLLSAVLLISLVRAQGSRFSQVFIRFFIPAIILGAALNAFELITDGMIYDAIRGIEHEAKSNLSHLNRGVVVSTLFIFPAILAFYLKQNCCPSKKYIMPALLVICTAVTFALTDSQSAHLAFVFGILSFVFFPVKSSFAWKVLWVCVSAMLIITPWIAQYLFTNLPPLISDIQWFKTSYAADRMEIWDFVSRHALQNPIYGFGIEATKAIEKFDTNMLYHKAQDVLHPHNFSVQFWIEYGLIGALSLMAFFFYLFRISQTLPAHSRKLALSCVLGFTSVAATGYGIWQGWFLGLMIILATYCIILNTATKSNQIADESDEIGASLNKISPSAG